MRRIGALVLALLVAGGVAYGSVELVYFELPGCPDCIVMSAFLEELKEIYPELQIERFRASYGSDDWRLMRAMADAHGLDRYHVPMVFVGEHASSGEAGPAVEMRIEEEVQRCLEEDCPSPLDVVEEVPEGLTLLQMGVIGAVVLVTVLVVLDLIR